MSLSRVLSRATPIVVSLLVLVASALAAADPKPDGKPEDVVQLYLESVKKGVLSQETSRSLLQAIDDRIVRLDRADEGSPEE